MERARDLFEQCLEKVPAEDAAEFYIQVRASPPSLPPSLPPSVLPYTFTAASSQLTHPPSLPPSVFPQYARLEEEHGLARHAMALYDRGTQAVPEDKRFDFVLLYIKKVCIPPSLRLSLSPTFARWKPCTA